VRSGQEEEWLKRIPIAGMDASSFPHPRGEEGNFFQDFPIPKGPFVTPMIDRSTGELSSYRLATIRVGREDYIEVEEREARFDPEMGKLYVAPEFESYYPGGIVLSSSQTRLPKKLLEERARNEEAFLRSHPLQDPKFTDDHLFCADSSEESRMNFPDLEN